MGTRNFDDLIQQILSMVGEEGKARRKKMEEDSYSGFVNQRAKEATDEYNLMMGRTPELKLETARGANTLANTHETNIGALARQRLVSEGATTVADITGRAHVAGEETMAGAHRYAADQKLEGDKYIAGAKDQPFSVWMKANPGADEETVKKMKRYFGTSEVKPEDVRSFDRTVAPETVTPPIRTPATTLPRAESMEFPMTDLGPNREALALAKKKSEERLLYGTKPQNRSWLSGF